MNRLKKRALSIREGKRITDPVFKLLVILFSSDADSESVDYVNVLINYACKYSNIILAYITCTLAL